ncbi:MAG: GGDEF domain-containing protein [Lachnospiraceae bacterium]|nr:MAG: GGDEF domain-containing protein [Lachnospiraceae bacterium]
MKSLINKFSKWLLSTDLKDMQSEINSRNAISLYRISQAGVIVTLLNILNQVNLRSYNALLCNLVLLVIQIIISIACFCCQNSVKQSPKATSELYLYESLMLVFNLVSSTFINHNIKGVAFLIYATVLPLLIIDIPWRVILFMTIWDTSFICCSFIAKSPHLFQVDLGHILMSYVNTLICLSIVLSSRLNEIKNHVRFLKSDRTDHLTNLYNRRYFLYLAKKELSSARIKYDYSIIYYDFNNIRDFNQEHGFRDGDTLLKKFAIFLQNNYPSRLCARFGEDHFVVLAKNDEWKNATINLIKDLDAFIIRRYGRHIITDLTATSGLTSDINKEEEAITMPLSIRCGVCAVPDSSSLESACDNARIACHYYSADNPFNFMIYDESIAHDIQSSAYVRQHIDEAVQKGYIKVYYQPIARAATNQICNEEALARWEDPTYGLLQPSSFIPILERHALLYKVDFYVLEQVLRDFKTRKESGMRIVPVSINLSRNDFYGLDVVKEVTSRVDAANCPHNLIDIEITESAYAADPKKIMQAMDGFHKAGFHVWMDDFGSGYSSLNLLKDSSFDLIKLDMRFMKNFDSRTEIVVGSILSMASQMGIDTLAEGVETEKQRNELRRLGCGRLQGYYYSKPSPLSYIIDKQTNNPGFTIEDHSHVSYYDQVSRFNLDKPLACFEDSLVEGFTNSLPAAISQWDDKEGTLLILRANTAFTQAQKDLSDIRYDFSALGATDQYTYVPGKETADAIRESISTGRGVSYQLIMNKVPVTFYVHMIGKDDLSDRNAILFVVIPNRS